MGRVDLERALEETEAGLRIVGKHEIPKLQAGADVSRIDCERAPEAVSRGVVAFELTQDLPRANHAAAESGWLSSARM